MIRVDEDGNVLADGVPGGSKIFDFNCVRGTDTANCVDRIVSGNTADLMILDAGDIYFHRDQLAVIAAENHDSTVSGGVGYYSVAAVKKSTNQQQQAVMNNVTSYTTCHTGIGKTAGWNMPMGWIKRHGLEASDITSSCAPGANDTKYRDLLPGPAANWCSLCVGDGESPTGGHKCSRNQHERFYGYDGAFKCMNSGAGEVAFIKHSTIPAAEQADYELLCGDGNTRKAASEWASCNLGSVPSHALVAKRGTPTGILDNIYNRLVAAMSKLSNDQKFGSGNLLWGDSVQSFHKVVGDTVRQFLGESYFCAIQHARESVVDPACEKSDVAISSIEIPIKS